MRQFVVDGLQAEERDFIKKNFEKTLAKGGIEGVYWLPVPPDLLGERQQGHEECGPFYFSIELGEDAVSFEFLVRGQGNLHCSCIGYATLAQRDFLFQFIDRLLPEGKITS